MKFLFSKQKIIYTCTKIQYNIKCRRKNSTCACVSFIGHGDNIFSTLFFFSLYYFKSLKRSVVYLFSTQKENRNLRSCVKGSIFAWKRTRYVYAYLFLVCLILSFYFNIFLFLPSPFRHYCEFSPWLLCELIFLPFWLRETIDVDILREETYVAKPTALLRRGGAQSIDRSTEGDTPPRGDDFAHPPTHVCICNAHTGSREAQRMADRTWIEPAGDRDCLLRSLAGEPACPVSSGGRRVTPPYRVLPLPPFHRRVTYNL